MRRLVTGTVAFAFAMAFAAGASACPFGSHETAQTTPPVVAQTTAPVLPLVPPADEPKS